MGPNAIDPEYTDLNMEHSQASQGGMPTEFNSPTGQPLREWSQDLFKSQCLLCGEPQPLLDMDAESRHYRVCHPDQEFPPDISLAGDVRFLGWEKCTPPRSVWCWVAGCDVKIPLSTTEDLHRHYRQYHCQNPIATNLSECPYPLCADSGSHSPMEMYGHLHFFHCLPRLIHVEDQEAGGPQEVPNDRGRSSSRASISSLDSMGSGDSCVSHPPRARRRKRKVVHVSSDASDRARRSRSTTEKSLSQSSNVGQALRGLGWTLRYQDTLNERRSPETQMATGWDAQPLFMCECCPKKPRKFITENELRTHEAVKRYHCDYCGSRFKTKTEREHHQSSLHVRRHSWSCSALFSFNRAFHNSPTRPDSWDACGYCGLEFPRSGKGVAQSVITDDDCNKRIHHLRETHRFRECNSLKKFFREDHFRQHLKHSHAGMVGKWMEVLTNACIVEEKARVAVTESAEASGQPSAGSRSA